MYICLFRLYSFIFKFVCFFCFCYCFCFFLLLHTYLKVSYTFLIDFIEKDGELPRQLESMYRLVDFHVKRYIDRGFTSLMISCGCTGGQHRSMYSAEHLAHHLHEKFGITVEVTHREQNINKTLE